MTRYALEYTQTSHERYDTDMNEQAREVIARHVTIDGEAGGSGFGEGMVGEQEFIFDTDAVTAQRVLREVTALLAQSLDSRRVITLEAL
jgi:hypothetical protein